MYNYYKCRCPLCTAAKREYSRLHPCINSKHGLPGTYNRGCRCQPCKSAFRSWARTEPQAKRMNKTNRDWRKRWHDKHLEFIRSFKDKPCMDCGNRYPPICMDFDHIPERGPKLFNVSVAAGKLLLMKKLAAEIAKCDVVCANCHRLRTEKRRLN